MVVMLPYNTNMQQQLAPLQQPPSSSGTSPRNAHGIKPIKNVKVPEGAYTTSPSDYRTYRKDTLYFHILTQHTDRQINLHMRLNMDIDLKRSIDTNYGSQWDYYTVGEALDAVRTIVLCTSNVAAYRKEFDGMVQKQGETIQEFVTRLTTCASDCSFVCPFDESHDLTDYHLINRLRSGIFHEALQQELLQKQDTLTARTYAHTTATEDPDIRSYFNVRDRLNVVDNLILYTFEDHIPRIVIPPHLQERVSKKLHAAHPGVPTIMTRARQTVYRPGIERSLEQ